MSRASSHHDRPQHAPLTLMKPCTECKACVGSRIRELKQTQNSENSFDCYKTHNIFMIKCFVFVITWAWQTANSLATVQITANWLSVNLLVPWKLLQRLFYCFSCSLIGWSWIISNSNGMWFFRHFFTPYLFHRSRNNRRDKLRSKCWREKMFRKPHLKLLRWFSVHEANNNYQMIILQSFVASLASVSWVIAVFLARQAIAVICDLNSGTFALVVGSRPLTEIEFSTVEWISELRPKTSTWEFNVSLGAVYLRDLFNKDTLFPVLIQPQERVCRHCFYMLGPNFITIFKMFLKKRILTGRRLRLRWRTRRGLTFIWLLPSCFEV